MPLELLCGAKTGPSAGRMLEIDVLTSGAHGLRRILLWSVRTASASTWRPAPRVGRRGPAHHPRPADRPAAESGRRGSQRPRRLPGVHAERRGRLCVIRLGSQTGIRLSTLPQADVGECVTVFSWFQFTPFSLVSED